MFIRSIDVLLKQLKACRVAERHSNFGTKCENVHLLLFIAIILLLCDYAIQILRRQNHIITDQVSLIDFTLQRQHLRSQLIELCLNYDKVLQELPRRVLRLRRYDNTKRILVEVHPLALDYLLEASIESVCVPETHALLDERVALERCLHFEVSTYQVKSFVVAKIRTNSKHIEFVH